MASLSCKEDGGEFKHAFSTSLVVFMLPTGGGSLAHRRGRVAFGPEELNFWMPLTDYNMTQAQPFIYPIYPKPK